MSVAQLDTSLSSFASAVDIDSNFLLKIQSALDTEDVYGSHCGIAGINPVLREQVELWIESKRFYELSLWLYSDSKAKQAYAAEGIIRGHNEGLILLSKTEREKIIELKESDVIVNHCSGCFRLGIEMREALKKFEFKR